MKIENRSHKLVGVGSCESERFVSSDSVNDSAAYDPVKTRLLESKAEEEGQPIILRSEIEYWYWFILPLLLPTPDNPVLTSS